MSDGWGRELITHHSSLITGVCGMAGQQLGDEPERGVRLAVAPRATGDWEGVLARTCAWAASRYGVAPSVARRLMLFRLRWQAQAHYGFTRAEAERLVFWRWLVARRAAAPGGSAATAAEAQIGRASGR